MKLMYGQKTSLKNNFKQKEIFLAHPIKLIQNSKFLKIPKKNILVTWH